jgi:glycosyltransferase involved in cell wall biosynthesis
MLTRPPIVDRAILVFIVAYEARRHLPSVLARVPRQLYDDPRVQFLCIDDASHDGTAGAAAEWVREYGLRNVLILRNPVNQNYGGNQKLGYQLALDAGFDFVILLHGDGQYAPELLPKFIETWEQTDADVVLGSRMTEVRSARAGGMPRYKIVGNRVLTTIQNKLTGLNLTEYHTGYRGYSTRFLRSVPFAENTNDFHFDTEILLQAADAGAKVVEFPIPTHYGDEICRVNGIKYAFDVLRASVQYKMHQLGMLCSLKYRYQDPLRYRDKTTLRYSSHALALRLVERLKPRKALDIGCGPGFVAQACERRGVRVTGVDTHPPLPDTMTRFAAANLEDDALPVDPAEYDVLLMLDVIEHLERPEAFLVGLRNRCENSPPTRMPRAVISTPNVAFFAMRLNLLLGRFNYAKRGILDITHKRLFTRKSLLRALADCGYQVEHCHAVGPPFEAVAPGKIGRVLGWFGDRLARLWPSLFAFQFIVVAKPLPGVRQLLRASELHGGTARRDAILPLPQAVGAGPPRAVASFSALSPTDPLLQNRS